LIQFSSVQFNSERPGENKLSIQHINFDENKIAGPNAAREWVAVHSRMTIAAI
jgi:hypothetical protein